MLLQLLRIRKWLISCAGLLLLSINSTAQLNMGGGAAPKIYDGKISGTVTDSISRTAIEFANISLFERGSKKPLDGTVSDEKGNFKLKNIKNGKYSISISFLGYANYTVDSILISDKKHSIDLGKILIQPSAKMLNEAVVEGEAPLIETKIDKIIYNAEKDFTSKGGNASDVLRKVPLLQVDLEGNVMLQGTQNVKVLINGKPSSLTAGSVADAMKMIPADEISKVEVITSPGAKYDAEGTGGIINIITKKKNIQGWSGMINAGAGTRSSNLFGNANYRTGRFGAGFNFGGFGYTGKGDLTTTRISPYSVLKQDGDNKNTGFGPYCQLTLDYDLTSKMSLTGSTRIYNFGQHSKGTTDNFISPDGNNFEHLYTTDFDTRTDGVNYDANIDFKRTFKKPDQELILSSQITNSNKDIKYDVLHLDSLGTDYYKENSLNASVNREITIQADYSHPFSKKFLFETGAKTILRSVKSDYDYQTFDYPSDAFVDDPLRSNVFDYDQDVAAGYVQGSLTLKKFGIKTGLRYEHTKVKGTYDKTHPPFGNEYDNFLPSATVSYTKQSKYTLKVSYTQRIQRPGMTYLNPYVNQSDSLNITFGNPQLSAEKSNAFEIGWNWFRKFGSINTIAYHRFTNNAIESIRTIDTNDIYKTTYANIGNNYSTGMSVGINVMWKMKIFMGSNFNGYYYKVKTTTTAQTLENDGFNYNVNLYGSYKFSTRWGVQAYGNFNGPKYSVQGKSTSFWYYNLSARREFKNEKGGIALGLDNFATWYMHFRNEYSGSDFSYINENKIFFLGVRLSFDYRFGKMDFSGGQKKKKGIKNDDVKDDEGGGMMNGGK